MTPDKGWDGASRVSPGALPSLCLGMAMVISPAAAAQDDGWMIELQTKGLLLVESAY